MTTIPICLVTGFLGSGKTTLLERIARRTPGRRLIFVVNEFSGTDVDAARLCAAGVDQAFEVVAIPGGSIFCKCLVTTFVERMRAVAALCATLPEKPDGVVIEASGMADPRVIRTLLAETRLDQHFHLARVAAVVDPIRFLKLLTTLPNIARQIEAADEVIVNKLDLTPEAALLEAEARIRALQPRAEIRRATYCDAPFDLFPAAANTTAVGGDYAKCRDPNYATETWQPDHAVDLDRLAALLETLPGAIYRLKGLCLTPAGWQEIDYDGLRFTARTLADTPGAPAALVFICRGDAAETVRAHILAVL